MLRPAMAQILKDDESYYAFVVAVAKRARVITDEMEEQGLEMTEKPVQIAVDEFAKGKYKIVESSPEDEDLFEEDQE